MMKIEQDENKYPVLEVNSENREGNIERGRG